MLTLFAVVGTGLAALRATTPHWTPAETVPAASIQATVTYTPGLTLDVYAPTSRQRGPIPVVVMLHGCCGNRIDLGLLARATAAAGALVLNADWSGIRPDGYPAAYQQAACAVRVGRMLAGRFGGDPGRIALLGWSDGAMIAAVVAESGDRFPGPCLTDTGSSRPEALVGVAGFYGWPSDAAPPEEDSPRAVAFFGGTRRSAPDAWAAGNPYSVLGQNSRLTVRLVVGSTDPLLADNQAFAAARRATGLPVSLLTAPDTGDQTMLSTRTAEGRITVRETLAALTETGRTIDGHSGPGRGGPTTDG